MKPLAPMGVFAMLVFSGGGVSSAQQTSTVTANQLRLDLRFIGHPPEDVIPPGESAITSLVIGADERVRTGHVYMIREHHQTAG